MISHRHRRRTPRRARFEMLEQRALLATLSNFLTNEHVDLNVTYNRAADTWDMQARNNDAFPVVATPLDDTLLYVGSPSASVRPAGSAFEFMGTAEGGTVYTLPQLQNPELVFLGVNAQTSAADFDIYNPAAESKGRASGNGRWLRVQVTDVAGPGTFSVWQSGASPAVFVSTYNDGVANPNGSGLDTTDGLGSDDAFWVLSGGHSHFNLTFSQPGRYEVKYRISGHVNQDGNSNTDDGVISTSQEFTAYYSVGNVGQLEFDVATYSVNEGAGTASIDVRRVGGSDGRLTVEYATSHGTATGGDYTSTGGTLTFNDLETTQTIVIPITDDALVEGNEALSIALSSPGPASLQQYLQVIEGRSLLAANATATLTIIDNDTGNAPPTISDVGPQTGTAPANIGPLSFTIGDAETPAESLVVSAVSSNTTLFPAGNITLGGSGATRTITLTPAAGQSGTATITLTVEDAGGLTATDTFLVTVNPAANAPPTVSSIAHQTILVGASTDPLPFTIGDAETPPASLIVTAVSSHPTLVLPGGLALGGSGANRTLTVTPAAGQSGTTTITLTVEDAGGATATTSFVLTVDPPANTPPTISPIPQQTILVGASTDPLPFTIGDAETPAASLIVSAVSSHPTLVLPSGLALGGSGASRTLTITPAAGQSGTTTITLTVEDAGGATATTSFVLTVDPPATPPEARDDAYLVYGANPLRGNVLFNDGGVAPLTASVVATPTGGTLSLAANGAFTYVPGPNFSGSDSFTYRATGGTLSALATVTIDAAGTQDFEFVLTHDHVDLGISFDGDLELSVHLEEEHEEEEEEDEEHEHDHEGEGHPPSEALFVVGHAGAGARPASSQFAFIGVNAGQTYWSLPETEHPELPFLGIGTEDIENGVFASNQVRLTLKAVNGPGHFSLWNAGASPIVHMATSDGVTAGDAMTLLTGSHTHATWSFSARGRYEITFAATGILADGTEVVSEDVTYYFSVDNVGRASFESASLSIDETAGEATIRVRRTGGSDGPATVHYSTADITASAGEDYEETFGTLEFADGETEAFIAIPIFDNDEATGNKTLRLLLSEPSEGFALGTPNAATLTIVDDEAPPFEGPVGLDGDTLIVNGTPQSDRIIVSTNARGGVSVRLNNVLYGPFSSTAVVVYGNDGGDTISFSGNVGPVTAFGGDGNDYIAGTPFADELDGGAGNDRLLGAGGDDILRGGHGNDTLSGAAGNDWLDGGDGRDLVQGDAGHDIAFGGAGNDNVLGGLGNDILSGDDGNDFLDGGLGNDLLYGGGGADRLKGGSGRDVLIGGGGADLIYGSGDSDFLSGDELLTFDESFLAALHFAWNRSGSLVQRMNFLAEALGSDLEDDGVRDTLYGEGDADWFRVIAGDLARDRRTEDRLS